MTRPLGEGLPSRSPPFAMSRRHVTPAAAGRDAAKECRNQMITEFFKPVLSQDRTVLSSPDKGNVKDEGMGLSVLRTEGFERSSPSPKKVRRKRCQTKLQLSPVVGVFWERIEEKDRVNMAEYAGAWVHFWYPKVVIQELLITAGSQM
ncbi:SLF2 protein, partial [Bombycilla garrulus]|nr:SLF2 protein [Bombycilla garrulus]